MLNVFIPANELRGYVWNLEDWLQMRADFRIIGNLVGNSSSKQQSDHFGLPALLLPEEITLLKEKQFARLLTSPHSNTNRNSEKLFETAGRNSSETMKELYFQRRKKELEEKIDIIIEGKKKKNPNINEKDKQKIIEEELAKATLLYEKNKQFLLSEEDIIIDEAKLVDAEWTYPRTEIEKLRYETFRDLWEKTYCLTCGTKFGGDFLCYEGDPVEFHATYIIMCRTNDAKISCKELISHGRIGTSTRKVVVIATKNYKENETHVTYLSLQWMENKKLEKLT